MAVATPTSPHKRSITNFSRMASCSIWTARPAPFRSVFPHFPAASVLPRLFSSTQLTSSIQTVAGIVSLYNDFAISRWGHSLGFLNPLLYSRRFSLVGGFKDIDFGGNPGCGTDGFIAATGWDPVRPVAFVSFFGIVF